MFFYRDGLVIFLVVCGINFMCDYILIYVFVYRKCLGL